MHARAWRASSSSARPVSRDGEAGKVGREAFPTARPAAAVLQPLLEPMVCVGLVVEGFDLAIALAPVERLRLPKRPVGLELERPKAQLPRSGFEGLEQPACDAASARGR